MGEEPEGKGGEKTPREEDSDSSAVSLMDFSRDELKAKKKEIRQKRKGKGLISNKAIPTAPEKPRKERKPKDKETPDPEKTVKESDTDRQEPDTTAQRLDEADDEDDVVSTVTTAWGGRWSLSVALLLMTIAVILLGRYGLPGLSEFGSLGVVATYGIGLMAWGEHEVRSDGSRYFARALQFGGIKVLYSALWSGYYDLQVLTDVGFFGTFVAMLVIHLGYSLRHRSELLAGSAVFIGFLLWSTLIQEASTNLAPGMLDATGWEILHLAVLLVILLAAIIVTWKLDGPTVSVIAFGSFMVWALFDAVPALSFFSMKLFPGDTISLVVAIIVVVASIFSARQWGSRYTIFSLILNWEPLRKGFLLYAITGILFGAFVAINVGFDPAAGMALALMVLFGYEVLYFERKGVEPGRLLRYVVFSVPLALIVPLTTAGDPLWMYPDPDQPRWLVGGFFVPILVGVGAPALLMVLEFTPWKRLRKLAWSSEEGVDWLVFYCHLGLGTLAVPLFWYGLFPFLVPLILGLACVFLLLECSSVVTDRLIIMTAFIVYGGLALAGFVLGRGGISGELPLYLSAIFLVVIALYLIIGEKRKSGDLQTVPVLFMVGAAILGSDGLVEYGWMVLGAGIGLAVLGVMRWGDSPSILDGLTTFKHDILRDAAKVRASSFYNLSFLLLGLLLLRLSVFEPVSWASSAGLLALGGTFLAITIMRHFRNGRLLLPLWLFGLGFLLSWQAGASEAAVLLLLVTLLITFRSGAHRMDVWTILFHFVLLGFVAFWGGLEWLDGDRLPEFLWASFLIGIAIYLGHYTHFKGGLITAIIVVMESVVFIFAIPDFTYGPILGLGVLWILLEFHTSTMAYATLFRRKELVIDQGAGDDPGPRHPLPFKLPKLLQTYLDRIEVRQHAYIIGILGLTTTLMIPILNMGGYIEDGWGWFPWLMAYLTVASLMRYQVAQNEISAVQNSERRLPRITEFLALFLPLLAVMGNNSDYTPLLSMGLVVLLFLLLLRNTRGGLIRESSSRVSLMFLLWGISLAYLRSQMNTYDDSLFMDFQSVLLDIVGALLALALFLRFFPEGRWLWKDRVLFRPADGRAVSSEDNEPYDWLLVFPGFMALAGATSTTMPIAGAVALLLSLILGIRLREPLTSVATYSVFIGAIYTVGSVALSRVEFLPLLAFLFLGPLMILLVVEFLVRDTELTGEPITAAFSILAAILMIVYAMLISGPSELIYLNMSWTLYFGIGMIGGFFFAKPYLRFLSFLFMALSLILLGYLFSELGGARVTSLVLLYSLSFLVFASLTYRTRSEEEEDE